jgi:hypothetical protein
MTDEPDNFGDDDKVDIDDVNIIDKLDILITLIENGPRDRYKALTNTLYEAKFQLLHAWNEVQYYMELCEGYEKTVKQVGDKLK